MQLPKETENPQMRYQWFSRIKANEHVVQDEVMTPEAQTSTKRSLSTS